MNFLDKKFNIRKTAFFSFAFVFTLIVGLTLVNSARAEWQEPDAPPTAGDFSAPITTGGENQAKSGYLLIDPVSYNPTEATSLVFTINRPLEVTGQGANFATPNFYTDRLTVDTDTLYADSLNAWVGVNTDWRSISEIGANVLMKVEGGNVQVGTSTDPINSVAVRAISGDNVGIYGEASSLPSIGVYGLRTASGGIAVKGEVSGTATNQVGVRGESAGGYGIYAVTDSDTYGAVYAANASPGWAAYFDGPLGTGKDIVADRFYSAADYDPMVPMVMGQKVGHYKVGEMAVGGFFSPGLAFDGTYLWTSNKSANHDTGANLAKIRAADGVVVDSFRVSGIGMACSNTDSGCQANQSTCESSPCDGIWEHSASPHDIAYDGKYLWITNTPLAGDSSLIKFDPVAGETITKCSTLAGYEYWGSTPNSLVVTEIDGEVFIWTSNVGGSDLTKFDRDCNQIGVYPLGTQGTGRDLNRINEDGWFYAPGKPEFDGESLWITTPSLCGTTAPYSAGVCTLPEPAYPQGNNCYGSDVCQEFSTTLVRVDARTGEVTGRFTTGMENPSGVKFDGKYLWVTASGINWNEKISKIRAEDGVLMEGYPRDAGCSAMIATETDGENFWWACNGEWESNPTEFKGATLERINIATDEMHSYPLVLSSNYWNGKLLYDGSFLWAMASCTDDGSCAAGQSASGVERFVKLTKIYAGQGDGHANLSSSIQLSQQSGVCLRPADPPNASNKECLFDRDCPNFSGTFGDPSGVLKYMRSSTDPDDDSQNAYAMAIDSTYMYVVGTDNVPTSFRIEKMKLWDGQTCVEDLVNGNPCGDAFGDGDGSDGDGIIFSDADSLAAKGVAVDDDYIYIVGSDVNDYWRVEKRLKTTGELCTGGICGGIDFSVDGILTGETFSLEALDVSVDDNFIYVVGNGDINLDGGLDFGHIAKYEKDTGALCTGGACGAGESFGRGTCSNPTMANYYCDDDFDCNWPLGETCDNVPVGFVQYNLQGASGEEGRSLKGMDVDGTYMYVAGEDEHIEKRRLDTGALDTSFDGNGLYFGSNIYDYQDIDVDGGYMYVSNGQQLHKISATDASFDSAFDGDGEVITDTANVQVVRVNGPHVYVGGWSSVGGYGWSMERRLTSDGSIDTSFDWEYDDNDSDGVVRTDTAVSNLIYDMQFDSDFAYLAGDMDASTVTAWRVEKRQITGATSGSLGNVDGNEICSVTNESQIGSLSIDGSLTVKSGHCYSNLNHYYTTSCITSADCSELPSGICIGGDTTVGGDVKADSNVWGGTSDTEVDLFGGVATCPEGYFIKGVNLDVDSKVDKIYCREL